MLKLQKAGVWDELPLMEHMAAVSVCQVNGQLLLDPNYNEDSQAEMDGNVVLTESGKILELQITSESKPYEAESLPGFMEMANKGIKEIIDLQHKVLGR
jgi:ribonuclease PH